MRIKCSDDEQQAEVNMTPIIDMVFLLLIFFLVATKFADIERDVRIKPPSSINARPITEVPSEIVINVARNGQLLIAGQARSLGEIDKLLARATKDNAHQSVVIRGDREAILQHAVDVLDLSEKHGVKHTYLTTTKVGK